MKIKVCGITQPEQLAELNSEFAGLIFSEKSKRNVPFSKAELFKTADGPLRIGVFVNNSLENIRTHIETFELWGVQLHGRETPEFAASLKADAVVIKAIGINERGFVLPPENYEEHIDFFLFDTEGKEGGGTGKKFNWELLKKITKPFFLAGGIGPEDIGLIRSLQLPALYSLDLNSRFEISPGVKDLVIVNKFIEEVKA